MALLRTKIRPYPDPEEMDTRFLSSTLLPFSRDSRKKNTLIIKGLLRSLGYQSLISHHVLRDAPGLLLHRFRPGNPERGCEDGDGS